MRHEARHGWERERELNCAGEERPTWMPHYPVSAILHSSSLFIPPPLTTTILNSTAPPLPYSIPVCLYFILYVCVRVCLSLLYRSAFQTTWSHPSKSTFISISLCSYLLYSSFSISLTFLLMVGSFIIYICSPAVTPFFIFFFLRSCCWLAFLYMYIHDDDAIQSIGSWTRCLRFLWLLHYIVDTMDGWMDIHVYVRE